MKLFSKSVFVLVLVLLLTSVLPGQTIYNTMTLIADPPPAPSQQVGSYVGDPGGITLYYWVAARYPSGLATPGNSIRVGQSVAIASLDATHRVQLQWNSMPGATGYYVIRQASSIFNGTCTACVVLTNSLVTTFSDEGGGTTNWPPAGVGTVVNSTYIQLLDNLTEATPFIATRLNGVEGRLMVLPTTATLEIPNDVDLGGTLDVTGAVTFDSTLEVTGTTTLTGAVTLGAGLIGANGAILTNDENIFKWRVPSSEIFVGGAASAWVDWSARTDAVVYGMRTRISSSLTGGTTTVNGKSGEVRAGATTAGGMFAGVRGTAITEAGLTGTDIFDGVFGSSNPSDGLVGATYGVFGVLNIDGTTTAGVNWIGAGVKGDFDDAVGLSAATNYTAGVMGFISDLDTVGPDGAVVAMLGGGALRSPANSPISAYRIIDLNENALVDFQYGFDAYWDDGVVTDSTIIAIADFRGQERTTIDNITPAIMVITDEADTVLGTENLANGADFSQATWTLAAEFAVDGTFATYTFAATGNGTITQTDGANLAIDGIGNQRYVIDYTISAAPTVAGATVTLTTAFGLVAVPLPITAGAHTVYFESAVTPADFVVDVTGATSGVFTIEAMSLNQVQSGDIVTRGTLRPVSVTFVDLPSAPNGTIIYCEDCDQAAAGAGPLVCASTPGDGAIAFRITGAWTCLGI